MAPRRAVAWLVVAAAALASAAAGPRVAALVPPLAQRPAAAPWRRSGAAAAAGAARLAATAEDDESDTRKRQRFLVDPTKPPPVKSIRMSNVNHYNANTLTANDDDPMEPTRPDKLFVDMFRSSAPYIRMHRGTTFVIHLNSEVMENREKLDSVLNDIGLVTVLGVKVVLVCSIRSQIDAKLKALGQQSTYAGHLRVTNKEELKVLQEMTGWMRSEVEASMARGQRVDGSGISVVSGNSFYSARPVGVKDGVDFGYTGEVRSVSGERIDERLRAGDLVLMSALGYSASGEVFNVESELVAREVAATLKAAKLVFVTVGFFLSDVRTGKQIQTMKTSDVRRYLDEAPVGDPPPGGAVATAVEAYTEQVYYRSLFEHACMAVNKGVARVHMLRQNDGALLQELYTSDGSGTLISRDLYEGIRRATREDIPAIISIIRPLEANGQLVPRSQAAIEDAVGVGWTFVYTRDKAAVACAQLRPWGDGCYELACLAVMPEFRRTGRGDAMLGYVERVAMATGGKMIFVLSTQTMHWFVERGFNECALEDLPVERREVYDYERKSKIYAKLIGNERQLAADELFWSGGLDKKRFGLVSGGNPWGGGAFAESPPPGTAVLPKNPDL